MGVLAERTLMDFMKAPDADSRIELVLHGDKVLPEMEEYYRTHELRPFEGVVTLEGILKDVDTGLWVSAFNLWEPGGDAFVLVYVVGNDEDGQKVDWRWYHQVRGEGLKGYFEEMREESKTVRAVLRRTHYYGALKEGDPEPIGIRVVTPFTKDFTGSIYLDPLTLVARRLTRELKWGQERMATMVIRWEEDDRYGLGNRVVIDEFHGWGLALEQIVE